MELRINKDELVDSILDPWGLYEGSRLMYELGRDHKEVTVGVFLKILDEKIGDIYYQSSAFSDLYSIDIKEAVLYIENITSSLT